HLSTQKHRISQEPPRRDPFGASLLHQRDTKGSYYFILPEIPQPQRTTGFGTLPITCRARPSLSLYHNWGGILVSRLNAVGCLLLMELVAGNATTGTGGIDVQPTIATRACDAGCRCRWLVERAPAAWTNQIVGLHLSPSVLGATWIDSAIWRPTAISS